MTVGNSFSECWSVAPFHFVWFCLFKCVTFTLFLSFHQCSVLEHRATSLLDCLSLCHYWKHSSPVFQVLEEHIFKWSGGGWEKDKNLLSSIFCGSSLTPSVQGSQMHKKAIHSDCASIPQTFCTICNQYLSASVNLPQSLSEKLSCSTW